MPVYLYLIPVVVVIGIFVVVMPMMKKQASKLQGDMQALINKKVHLNILIGDITAINGTAPKNVVNAGTYYGVDEGEVTISISPNLNIDGDRYSMSRILDITFPGQAGRTYQFTVVQKEPKEDDPSIIHVTELSGREIVFKTKLYLVVSDVTNEQGSKLMRGQQA